MNANNKGQNLLFWRVVKIRLWVLLCLLAIEAASVLGQIVVVRQADGTEHRFFAGNVKEILFESEADVIEGSYSELEVKAFTGNFILRFSGEGMPDLSLDVYTDRTSYLPDGLYPVSLEDSVSNAISGKFTTTYLSLPSGNQKLRGGHMKLNGTDGDYTIEMEFEAEDGTLLAASYNGSLGAASRYVPLQMARATWEPVSFPTGRSQFVRLVSADENSEVRILLYGPQENEDLIPGVYIPSEEGGIGTYRPSSSTLIQRYPQSEFPLQGNVEIGGELMADSVSCRAESPDGRIFIINYSGEINPITPEGEDEGGDEYELKGEKSLTLKGYVSPKEREDREWEYWLNVFCMNGNVFRLSFDKTPKVEFAEGEVCVSDGGNEIIRGDLSVLHKLTVSREERSGLHEIVGSTRPSIRIENGGIRVTGLHAGESIACYTMQGIVIDSAMADDRGDAKLSASSDERGPVIVRFHDRGISFKIITTPL